MIDDLKPLLKRFIIFAKDNLNFQKPPRLFLKQDTANQKCMLGKTAHYDPQNQAVTLYISGRHPKDILRSFAHELVHHCQHERGDLHPDKMKTMNQNYAQENDHMRKMEKEAYLQGNMCFRDWEDGLDDKLQYKMKLAEQKFLKENKTMSVKISKKELKGLIEKLLENKLKEQDNPWSGLEGEVSQETKKKKRQQNTIVRRGDLKHLGINSIENLQQRLVDAKYAKDTLDNGKPFVDGDFGEMSQLAVARMQADLGLGSSADGVIGRNTLRRLNNKKIAKNNANMKVFKEGPGASGGQGERAPISKVQAPVDAEYDIQAGALNAELPGDVAAQMDAGFNELDKDYQLGISADAKAALASVGVDTDTSSKLAKPSTLPKKKRKDISTKSAPASAPSAMQESKEITEDCGGGHGSGKREACGKRSCPTCKKTMQEAEGSYSEGQKVMYKGNPVTVKVPNGPGPDLIGIEVDGKVKMVKSSELSPVSKAESSEDKDKPKPETTSESNVRTPEQENALYESRFTQRNTRLFEKLLKEWTK